MQWAKAKTIMIWLFLVVDIILLMFLAVNKLTDRKDSNEKLTNILKSNNLTIREELLNHESKKVFAHEFSALPLSNTLASSFINDPVKKDNQTYESKNKKATIHMESGYFRYENKAPDSPNFSDVSEKNVNNKLNPYLKALKVDKYVRPMNITHENDIITVSYSYFFDNKELYSGELTFEVTKKGIKSAYGNVNIPNKKSGYDFTLSGIETVLLNFVQNNNFPNPETIVSINEGYYLINYQNLLIAQAIPVYRIKTTSKTYIYDAREGIDASKRQLYYK